MKRFIIILLLIIFFIRTSDPVTIILYANLERYYEHVEDGQRPNMLNIVVKQFQNQKAIKTLWMFSWLVFEEIRPVLDIKYKNVVYKVKYRPQSARIMVEESFQNLYLQKQNICSIIKTRNFVSC